MEKTKNVRNKLLNVTQKLDSVKIKRYNVDSVKIYGGIYYAGAKTILSSQGFTKRLD